MELVTEHLRLVAASFDLLEAELESGETLAARLGVRVPEAWPPPLTEDARVHWLDTVRKDPLQTGWWSWYWIRTESEGPRGDVLIGCGGFFGPPDAGGTVTAGYSVLDLYQGRGYATEALEALVEWAFRQPGAARVVADTFPDISASIRVLTKLGFEQAGEGAEPGSIRFRRERPEPGSGRNRIRPQDRW